VADAALFDHLRRPSRRNSEHHRDELLHAGLERAAAHRLRYRLRRVFLQVNRTHAGFCGQCAAQSAGAEGVLLRVPLGL
jgi:hypothetical protein